MEAWAVRVRPLVHHIFHRHRIRTSPKTRLQCLQLRRLIPLQSQYIVLLLLVLRKPTNLLRYVCHPPYFLEFWSDTGYPQR
jgi:hypothetical protein